MWGQGTGEDGAEGGPCFLGRSPRDWPLRRLCPPPGSPVTSDTLLNKLHLSFHIGELGMTRGPVS